MPAPELDLHGNHWINAIGHSAGVVVFARLGWLLYRDAKRQGQPVRALPIVSTLLALAFDLFLMAAVGFREQNAELANGFAALAFAALSVLPAVLLDISLRGGAPTLRRAGYLLSGACAALHLLEVGVEVEGVHSVSLLTLSLGFAVLAVVSYFRQRSNLQSSSSASICLFLLALSFLHFLAGARESGFWAELILHHAGIPLALIVVLQDYRFLLLDAFLRLATNGALAAVFVGLVWQGREWIFARAQAVSGEPFQLGLLFVVGAGAFLLFALLREQAQLWLTRRVFLRRDPAEIQESLRRLEGGEEVILETAAKRLADYFRAQSWLVDAEPHPGYEASVRLRFLKGDSLYLHLGGRRLLSEDLESLESLAAMVAREVDRARAREMERLVVEAELRALQSQIHPHFLFNALNALYGSIPRQAANARRLVLSLSEVFRYFLTTAKPSIRLEEELHIIEAYLEIEKARLGPRLRTEIEVSPDSLGVSIPVLTIQPLVENAIKHGVAAQSGPGEVRIRIRREGEKLLVWIEDTGPGLGAAAGENARASNRVGLENVKKRLALHYGSGARIAFEKLEPGTRVVLEIPAGRDLATAEERKTAVQGN